jgi:alkanesulfonate monooxygenase SsuD/methylene tetrahydromethanopterin reductase-like flavin-dependent oxidoreductase (luciferase family)
MFMSDSKPAVSLAAIPGRRAATLELAQEIERRGYAGIYSPSNTDNMMLCAALAQATNDIPLGTTIAPIYSRTPFDYARAAAFIQELSSGRFRFGIGVSHEPALKMMGVNAGKPLSDIRNFVEAVRAVPRAGDLPPIVLATLRKKMIALSAEIAEGMVFANASLSHTPDSLTALPADKRSSDDFFVANMVPTCISDDIEAAKAVNRRTLTGYARLPNYRNYWKEAGYVEEMEAVEAAIAAGEDDRIPDCLSDRWLLDVTLAGTASQVREGVEAWQDAGIKTLILVPSSAVGNQFKALEEMFETFG